MNCVAYGWANRIVQWSVNWGKYLLTICCKCEYPPPAELRV